MSTSTRSKPASPSSPATGDGADAADADKGAKNAKDDKSDRVEIELEVSRQRQIAWAIGGTFVGVLLVLKLGTVAVWGGYVLIALGLFRAYQLAMTLIYPAGKIVVTRDKVSLPRGLHRPRPIEVEPSAVTAAYFLRRSVPWNRASPVLVVELGDQAMAFPRDWFESETDQRRAIMALLRHLDTDLESSPAAT